MFEDQQVNETPLTEEQELAGAMRHIAMSILPSLIRAHPAKEPKLLVMRGYEIAHEVITQGMKL